MIDETGKKVWEETFDLWGKPHDRLETRVVGGAILTNVKPREETTHPEISQPFRFPGQYHDEETGMYYNRFRYYMPGEGMYTQRDPIGLSGGNPTTYGYVFNTLQEVDPFGLRCTHKVSNPKQFHKAVTDKWNHSMTPREMREVHNTIDRIKLNKPKHIGRDGSEFRNSNVVDPTSQRLNTKGIYREWTVDAPGISNRGLRRIVVDTTTGRAFYTNDHYTSFIEIVMNGWR